MLDLSLSTIQREWRFARALLFTQLSDGDMAGHESEPGPR